MGMGQTSIGCNCCGAGFCGCPGATPDLKMIAATGSNVPTAGTYHLVFGPPPSAYFSGFAAPVTYWATTPFVFFGDGNSYVNFLKCDSAGTFHVWQARVGFDPAHPTLVGSFPTASTFYNPGTISRCVPFLATDGVTPGAAHASVTITPWP